MKQYNEDVSLKSQPTPRPGPYLAKVVGYLDPNYMGGIEVEILRPVGNSPISGEVHQVKYMSPFYGVTGSAHVTDDPDNDDDQDLYENTQKSYGMWMIPPDYGTIVVIIFIDGDPKRGYWLGCVQDHGMNFMMPGLACTENVTGKPEKDNGETLRVPTADYNNKTFTQDTNPTKFKKPKHPFATVLATSGLKHDDTRGTTTSSARREAPSMVFGISTPGPIDKDSSKIGTVGKADCSIKAPVSRKGGSTFVMDDGDDRFIRKKKATEAGPEYSDVIADGKGGAANYNIPHNELIRIRTRSGHQILLHNSEDLIYISHGSGNSWIEMTANGKIDVYAKDSISMHTEKDFNFHADRDINFQAGNSINFKAVSKGIQFETGASIIIKAKTDGNITTGGKFDCNIGGNFSVNAANTSIDGGNINLNSGSANTKAAESFKTSKLPTNEKGKTIESIMRRVPTKEPWAGHENLDPTSVTPEKTDRTKTDEMKEPEAWNKYSTTDTFNKTYKAS
jgi:hypothetical protein